MKKPVLLIAFNRPDTLQPTFQAVQKYQPEILYFAVDGPRLHVPGESEKVTEVKAFLQKISWDCQVKTLFSEANKGCKLGVKSAIDWFFSNVEEGIILEDDCVPEATFFDFCEDMLEYYRNDQNVMMVSGTNYLFSKQTASFDHFFLRYFSIWGWATWKRAWLKYDLNMTSYNFIANNKCLHSIFPESVVNFYLSMANEIVFGKMDTWDLQWVFTCLANNGLAVAPMVNLISNIGYTGTHTGAEVSRFIEMPCGKYKRSANKENKVFLPNYALEKQTFMNIGVPWTQKISETINFRNFLKPLLKKSVTTVLKKFGLTPSQSRTYNPIQSIVKGRALVSYIKDAYESDEEKLGYHSNVWECKCIIQMFLDAGYIVDVINWDNKDFVVKHEYQIVFDIHSNIARLRPFLNNSPRFWLHLTGSNPEYSNRREAERIRAMELRKRKYYNPKRVADEVFFRKSYELSTCISLIGNDHTLKTYPKDKTVTLIPVSTSPVVKKSDYASTLKYREFLWFNGMGAVHKGLDILLDLFEKNPNYILNVVGPVEAEKDFLAIYGKQLFHLSNINYHGYLKPQSKEMTLIASRCLAFISPSCSEGTSTASLACMQMGMIPIISLDNGITITNEHGYYLSANTEQEIEETISKVYSLSDTEVVSRIIATQTFVMNSYNREKFKSAMSSVFSLVNQ